MPPSPPTTPPTPSNLHIRATELNPTSFHPFGQVIQNPATHDNLPRLDSVPANQGTARKWLEVTRMRDWYEACGRRAARCVMNMFVCQPRELRRGREFAVRVLERHPFTAQTFVPVGLGKGETGTCYLVVVAPTLPGNELPRRRSWKDLLLGPSNGESGVTSSSLPEPKGTGRPDLNNIRAFIAHGDQAVTYGPGTWHAPMVVLGERAIDFVVVQYANGVAEDDCQEVEIEDGRIQVDLTGEEAVKAKL